MSHWVIYLQEKKISMILQTFLGLLAITAILLISQVNTLNSISAPSLIKRLYSPMRTDNLFRTQWAAVSTQRGETKVPPQKASLINFNWLINITCLLWEYFGHFVILECMNIKYLGMCFALSGRRYVLQITYTSKSICVKFCKFLRFVITFSLLIFKLW